MTHRNIAAQFVLFAALSASMMAGCSSGKLGLKEAQPTEKAVDLDAEARRVREMQLVRYTVTVGQTTSQLETDGSQDLIELVDAFCGFKVVTGVNQPTGNYFTSPHVGLVFDDALKDSPAAFVEADLCAARMLEQMSETARTPMTVQRTRVNQTNQVLAVETVTVPVQSSATSVLLLQDALTFVDTAWFNTARELKQYLTDGSMPAAQAYLAQFLPTCTICIPQFTTFTVSSTADTRAASARKFGSLLAEEYYLRTTLNSQLVERTVNVADAEWSSTPSLSLRAFRSIPRPKLSRSAAAHFLVGGDLGLPGIEQQSLCTSPALTPQAQKALQVFRKAAPSPDVITDPGVATVDLLNDFQSTGGVKTRLTLAFGERIPTTVEEHFGLTLDDFEQARKYLQDEIRTYSRTEPYEAGFLSPACVSAPECLLHPSVASPPESPRAYWAAVARTGNDVRLDVGALRGGTVPLSAWLGTAHNDLSTLLAKQTTFNPSASPWSLSDPDQFKHTVFDAAAEVAGDVSEIYRGNVVTIYNSFGAIVQAIFTDAAKNALAGSDLRWVDGEAGLSCAVLGKIEGVVCNPAQLSGLTLPHVETSSSNTATEVEASELGNHHKIYLVESSSGSTEPGRYVALAGIPLQELNDATVTRPIVPSLEDRAGQLLEPGPAWCTRPKITCAGADFDERIPLENELSSDADPVESSWRSYLDKAKDAATQADELGSAFILASLDQDNRTETVEMRDEARRAQVEQTLSELQDICGTDVDPGALLALVSGTTQGDDLANMRQNVSCTTDSQCDATKGFKCMAGACIIEPAFLLQQLEASKVELDPQMSEGLHRLNECIGADSETDFVSLGTKPLCAWYPTGAPSQLCAGASADLPCPTLSRGDCTLCTAQSTGTCQQGPSTGTYVPVTIGEDDLLNYFDSDKLAQPLNTLGACAMIGDALRYDPTQILTGTGPDFATYAKRIIASNSLAPDKRGKVANELSWTPVIGGGSRIEAASGTISYSNDKPGNLWWYGNDDLAGMKAVLALNGTVSLPAYLLATDSRFKVSRTTTSESRADGGTMSVGKVHAYRQVSGSGVDAHFDEIDYRTYGALGQTDWAPWPGFSQTLSDGAPFVLVDPLVYDKCSRCVVAERTWGWGAPDWAWNGFSNAAFSDGDALPVCDGAATRDCSLLDVALAQDRTLSITPLPLPISNTGFATLFNGDYEFLFPGTFAANLKLTTTDLLHAAQLACDIQSVDDGFRCDPANPPQIGSTRDLARAKDFLVCQAARIEGRAALTIFAHFPRRAADFLRKESVLGAYPAVGGEVGQHISQLRAALVQLNQYVLDTAAEVRKAGITIDSLRTNDELASVRDKIVDNQFKSTVTNLIAGCAESIAETGSIDPARAAGHAAAAAITCANAFIQSDLASELNGLQEEENELTFQLAFQEFRDRFETHVQNMAHLKSQVLEQEEQIDTELSAIEELRNKARHTLSRALYEASSRSAIEAELTNVYANRSSVAQVRYKRAHDRAVKLAFLAKRAIETRLGVDLATMTDDFPLVPAPSTWESTLCDSTGVDYAKLRQDTTKFNAEDFADDFIGSYVQKLDDFVESYRLKYGFHEGNDTAVISLKNDIFGAKATCEVNSRNEILDSSALDKFAATSEESGWQPAGCVSDLLTDCVSVQPLAPDVTPVFQPLDPELAAAGAFGVQLGSAVTSSCSYPDCGYQDGAAWVQQVVPSETHFPQTYVLSWYYPATDAQAGLDSVDVTNDQFVPLSGVKYEQALASEVEGWARADLRVTLDAAQPIVVRIGAVYHARNHGSRVRIAAPMLEAVAGPTAAAGAYENTGDGRLRTEAACPDTDGTAFHSMTWNRNCLVLCPDGFGSQCDQGRGITQCYREALFDLSQRYIESGKQLVGSGFAKGNFNYRIDTVALNLVGTGIQDCSRSATPESCYASGNVQYSLLHSAPFIVRNHMGIDYEARLFPGRIEQARALATERYITNPIGSADRDLLSGYTRAELSGRPVDGHYAVRIWESPTLDFDAITDVQLVLNYRYWTRTE